MFTVAEVAKELNLSYNTVKSYIRKGYIKATKFGGWQLSISQEEFDRLKEKYLKGGEQQDGKLNSIIPRERNH